MFRLLRSCGQYRGRRRRRRVRCSSTSGPPGSDSSTSRAGATASLTQRAIVAATAATAAAARQPQPAAVTRSLLPQMTRRAPAPSRWRKTLPPLTAPAAPDHASEQRHQRQRQTVHEHCDPVDRSIDREREMHLARRPGLTEGAPRRAAFGRANSFAPPPSPRYVPDPDSCACTLAQDRLEKKNCTELAQIASQL